MGPDEDDVAAAKADWEVMESLSPSEQRQGVIDVIRDLYGDEELARKMGDLVRVDEEE